METINPEIYQLVQSGEIFKGTKVSGKDREEIRGNLIKALQKSKHELKVDKELALESGLKDFAMPGLYSIILSRDDSFKTRLFVFDGDHTKLGTKNVPIHAHKYIDLLTPLFGKLVDHVFKLSDVGFIADSYSYSRYCDDNQIGLQSRNSKVCLKHITSFHNQVHLINAGELHTVNVCENQVAWVIQELEFNNLYHPSDPCYLLPSMDDLPKFETTKMTAEDFDRVKLILDSHGYILDI